MISQILLRVKTEMKEALRIESKKRGQTLNALILQILWEWLNRQKNDNEAS